jgi:hypothetical protein
VGVMPVPPVRPPNSEVGDLPSLLMPDRSVAKPRNRIPSEDARATLIGFGG